MRSKTTLHTNRKARSRVWLEGEYVYKVQPKFLCDNEIWCFDVLWPSGYVPSCERVNLETIRTEYIKTQPITNLDEWQQHINKVLEVLKKAGIKHGDLTEYAVIPHANRPFLIDFGESRLWDDPRPDKRPEGDAFWLRKTMEQLANA